MTSVIRGTSDGRGRGCAANHLRRCQELFADPFVCELSQCLGCFYTRSVEGEVLGLLAIVKQFLRFMRRLGADRDAGQAQHVHLAIGFRHKKVGDGEVAALFPVREGEG